MKKITDEKLDAMLDEYMNDFDSSKFDFDKAVKSENKDEAKELKPWLRILIYSSSAVVIIALLAVMIFISPFKKVPVGTSPTNSQPTASPSPVTPTTISIIDTKHDQVAEYLRKALQSSLLATVDKRGKVVSEIKLPNTEFITGFADTSAPEIYRYRGSLSPDGKHLLIQNSIQGPAEGYAIFYKVIDMESGAEYLPSSDKGRGLNLRILGNNLIGSAFGDTVELYDIHFQPLDVTFDFSGIDLKQDNSLAGISYDSVSQHYIITAGFDATGKGDSVFWGTFSTGVYIFDTNGKLIDSKVMPVEYHALTNPVTGLSANNPVILDNGWFTIIVRGAAGQSVLLINSATWEIKPLDYSEINILDDKGSAFGVHTMVGKETYFLLSIQNGAATQIKEITSPPVTPDYYKEFTYAVSSNAASGGNFYIMAQGVFERNGTHLIYSGLFYLDGDTMKLIQLLPSLDLCNMVGVDANGNCQFFISGANDRNRAYIEKALSDFAAATGQ